MWPDWHFLSCIRWLISNISDQIKRLGDKLAHIKTSHHCEPFRINQKRDSMNYTVLFDHPVLTNPVANWDCIQWHYESGFEFFSHRSVLLHSIWEISSKQRMYRHILSPKRILATPIKLMFPFNHHSFKFFYPHYTLVMTCFILIMTVFLESRN